MITLTSITIFPIKACAGVSVPAATLDRLGLVGDRRFLVVDQDGNALTQRDCRPLREVRPLLDSGSLIVKAPGMDQLAVSAGVNGRGIEVRIWDDTCLTNDCGDDAAEWFSAYLGQSCRLVRANENFMRQIDLKYASTGQHTAFTDGFPILLISEESLADLNGRLPKPAVMSQFRPNLVVRDCEPFAEDQWTSFRIGDLRFSAVKPCLRCVVTTINPNTGETSPEPLRTLATYRKSASGGVLFGQNVIPLDQSGSLKVGDHLTLL